MAGGMGAGGGEWRVTRGFGVHLHALPCYTVIQLVVTTASNPEASTDPSDEKVIVRLVPDEVTATPLP